MFDIFCVMQGVNNPRVYRVTSYGADPTGNSDSTEALLAAIEDAAKGPSEGAEEGLEKVDKEDEAEAMESCLVREALNDCNLCIAS